MIAHSVCKSSWRIIGQQHEICCRLHLAGAEEFKRRNWAQAGGPLVVWFGSYTAISSMLLLFMAMHFACLRYIIGNS